MNGHRYRTAVSGHDAVFGTTDRREFEEDDAYLLLWAIFYDTNLKSTFLGRKNVKIEHVQTGDCLTVAVDFDGVDEDDFSAPMVVNAARLDSWIAAHEGTPVPDAARS